MSGISWGGWLALAPLLRTGIASAESAVAPRRQAGPGLRALRAHGVPRPPAGPLAIPLRTPLLVPGDDICEIARVALERLAARGFTPSPADVLVICETPLAITQDRIVEIDRLHPGIAARVFCRLFGQHGSLSTVYGMQAAINLVGLPRIATALGVGAATRLVGRRGDFYRLAGRQVAWIDDITGTMAPYTQDIALGPDDPVGVACRLARELGCGVAVVDANDLGKVEVLGASPGADLAALVQAMRKNPQGNDDEQTPLVLVRPAPRPERGWGA